MKTVIVTSATTVEPITLAEAKTHLRITSSGDNDYINTLIRAARRRVEDLTNRKMLTQTWKVYFDNWPAGNKDDYFDIPYSPLQSIPTTGLKYTMSTGNSTTFSSSKWETDTVSEPGRLVLDYGYSWPSNTLNNRNPIEIRFVCGYTTPAKVPEELKLAMKILVGHYYENREMVLIGQTLTEIPESVKALISNYRIHTF